jgi:NTP pyrophosphatase (non-canonical NTP hydrolase)
MGELANKAKKVMWHGHAFDETEFVDELGDCLWYFSEIATTLGLDLSDIAEFNIDKLKSRYPEGFSEEASVNRKG